MRPNCERFDCFPIQVSSFSLRLPFQHLPFFNDFDALSNPLSNVFYPLYRWASFGL